MKKLMIILLAGAMATTMAACGGNTEPSEAPQDSSVAMTEDASADEAPVEASEPSEAGEAEGDAAEGDAAEGDAAEGDAAEGDAAGSADLSALPEIDGFTKTDTGTGAAYAAADGSMIMVQMIDGDAAIVDGLKNKDAEIKAQMDELFNSMMGAMLAGTTVTGDFASVSGKDCYTFNMSIPKDESKGIMADMTVEGYMFAAGDQVAQVFGMSMGTDVAKGMEDVLAAL